MTDRTNDIEKIFGPEGLLSEKMPGYEHRPGQMGMASAVLGAFESETHLLVEAGTGTGKTLAYLIPAVAASLKSKQKVIISTGTKNLQEQLMQKDIPFLQEVLPRGFKAVYMKGRGNYVCIDKVRKATEQPILDGLGEVGFFEDVRRWSEETETGDRAELTQLPERLGFWNRISARSDTCLGQKCPEFNSCFITRMRDEAEEADIVVVNHHLFFADLNLRGNEYGRVLPDYSFVIFDEAHLIEDVASDYFGFQVSNYQIDEVIRDAGELSFADAVENRRISRLLSRVKGFADLFWSRFKDGRGRDGRMTLQSNVFFEEGKNDLVPTNAGEAYEHLDESLGKLLAALEPADIGEESQELESVLRRLRTIRFELEFVVKQSERNFVYWIERRGRGVFLRASPIDVSGLLEENLFSRIETAVLTSATLAALGRFDFIKARLGLGDAETMIAPTSFDYRSQAVIYLPRRMPEPRDPEFVSAAAEEIIRLLGITDGRAFVLATSNYSMNALFELVSSRVSYPCFVQGSMSRSGLLESFRKTPNSVLFATASFWQGVDVRGDDLSCVIIDKLPFAVPSDPLVAARTRFIDESGGRSFFDYSVPNAIISLKQGTGRLIRSTTDSGVIALLDPRLRTKSYGREFLASLPPANITDDPEAVRKHFEIHSAAAG